MTKAQAREALLIYRPGTGDDTDPEVALALTMAREDADLARWFTQQQAFQAGVRRCLQGLEPPADLEKRILANDPPGFGWRWPRRAILAIAAALVLMLGGLWFWLGPRAPSEFETCRSRMAKFALIGYGMDLATNDLQQIHNYVVKRGGPGDYVVHPSLAQLQTLGCAVFTWHGQPVSMLCFDRGNKQLVWLFVMRRGAVKDAPSSASPRFSPVNKLSTASWTEGGNTYVLGLVGDEALLRKYL